MTVSRDERHHGAQASTDDFNRMSGRLSTDGAKHRSADLVFKEEVLSVRTVLNVAQSFSHRCASLVGNNLWTGDVAAELSVVRDGVVHICQAAFVDQVNDQLHFMAAFEVSHFRSVAGFNQGFEAHLDQFGNAAAQNALIAQVATSWINLGAQKEFLRLQKITLQSQEESFKLMSDSYRLGASSLLELEQARTTVATARAAVAQYERSLAQAQNALNLVVGSQVPADLEPNNLEEATNYGAIAPAGLSSDILLNRPDIKAAEHDLMSANANIGAARANFFPRISLTAGIGSSSRHLSDLFDAGTGLWTFAPSVSLPIFTGGANLSTLRQAEAQQKIMVATYEKTVQNAFAEVSDALATVGTVNRQCAALKDLVNATETAYRLSQSRYKNGLDGFLTVLESQRQMVAAQTNYISAESNRLSSGVMLYKVLGGGSVIEPETRAAAQTEAPAAAEQAQAVHVSSGGGNA